MNTLELRERANSNMKKAVEGHSRHGKEHAKYEKLYRVTLAKKILRLKDEGYAVTLITHLAEGDIEVAQHKEMRNIEYILTKSAENAIVNYRKEMEQFHEDYKIDMTYNA